MFASDNSSDSVVVATLENEHGLRAARSFRTDEIVVGLNGRITNMRGRLTIETGVDRHLDPEGHVWGFSNHACNPNAWVDLATLSMRALRTIRAGEEITWNYLTTEWELAHPFQCLCHAPGCLGAIRGLRFLPPEQVAGFASQISPPLRSRLDKMPACAIQCG
jgi:hypothetical protein